MHPNARPLTEAQRQLSLLQGHQDRLVPALYRDLALYLQVLREGLLPAVQQACFHLATQVHPERYAALDPEGRVALQERLRELSQRCGCLLTVEQLMSLAGQLERRQRRRERTEQRRLLEALAADVAEDGEGHRPDHEGGGAQPAPGSPAEPELHPDAGLPKGSISLGLDLPLSADLFLQGMPGLADLPALMEAAAPRPDPMPGDPDRSEGLPAADPPEADGPETPGPSAGPGTPEAVPANGAVPTAGQARRQGQALFQALYALAAEGLGEAGAQPDGSRPGSSDADASGGPVARAATLERPLLAQTDTPASNGWLPRDPLALLAWWQQVDRALERRLRNLSHALNLELMRLGLSRSLLPPNLLDAVLSGQVEALPAPANLLRLPVPLPPEGRPAGVPAQVLAVLLRPSDLELEQPRLRTCRRRLEQRRRELRTMAQRHRYWQQRVLALQAEQQWLQDSAPPPAP